MWMFDGNLKVNQQPKLTLIFLYIPIKKIATAFTHFLLLLVLYKYCLTEICCMGGIMCKPKNHKTFNPFTGGFPKVN